MSTPAFVSWWPAPRNLRPSVTAWLRIATSPIATANTTRPTSATRRAPGRSSTTINLPRAVPRRTRRTLPRRSSRRLLQCLPPTPTVVRGSCVLPVRERTTRARALMRRGPRNRDPPAARACATRQACGRGCRPPRRTAGRRPRSRRSSSRSAPPPRCGGRARLDDHEHRRREQHVLEPLRARDGVRARRVCREVDAPQATPRARAARAHRARARPAATRRSVRCGRAPSRPPSRAPRAPRRRRGKVDRADGTEGW